MTKHGVVWASLGLMLAAGTAHAGVLDKLHATLSSMQADQPVRVHVRVERTVTKQDKTPHADKSKAGKPKAVKTKAAFALYADHGRFRVSYPAGLIQRMDVAPTKTSNQSSTPVQHLLDAVGAVRTHALLNEAPHLLRLLHGATLASRHAGKYAGKPVQVLLLNVPFVQPWPPVHDIDHASRQLELWVGADGVPVAMSEVTTVKSSVHISFFHVHENTKESTTAALRHVGQRLMATTWRYRKSTSQKTSDTRVELTLAHGQATKVEQVAKAASPADKAGTADNALARLRGALSHLQPVMPANGTVHVRRSVSVKSKLVTGPASATASANFGLHADQHGFQMTYPASLLARVQAEAVASDNGKGKPKPLAGLLAKFGVDDAHAMLDAVPKLLYDLQGATLQSQHAVTWHGHPVQLLVFKVALPHSFPKMVRKYIQFEGQSKFWVNGDDVPLAMSESVHFKIDHRFFLVLPIHIEMQGSKEETLRCVGQRLLVEHEHHRVSMSRHGMKKTEDVHAKLTLSPQHQAHNDASAGFVSAQPLQERARARWRDGSAHVHASIARGRAPAGGRVRI